MPNPDAASGASTGGWFDQRFAAVRSAFAENFAGRGETGAAVCVMVDGKVVADMFGGWRDTGRTLPWQRDTLVNVFSVGKGLTAACVARLIGQGRLDPDAPVIRYWPEFAAGGKSAVTVRQLLSHQAGLPAFHREMPAGSMLSWEVMTSALAAEEPWWTPGGGHGYHVNTFGFLAGELIRRISGLTPGVLLRRELAGPVGADVHIGLAAADFGRVADFSWPDASPANVVAGRAPDIAAGEQGGDGGMTLNAYFNPPDFSGAGVVNTAAWRSAEIPSANAHATASGIARMYAALVAGGALDGERIVAASALRLATEQQVYGEDLVLRRPSRFGMGFQLTHPERELGKSPLSFGHFGAGGSVGFCDPEAGLAFGYVTSQMGPRWRNPRNRALIDACYASLSAG
jgi:CubicO group peptidase (beta-lactamase class C family)